MCTRFNASIELIFHLVVAFLVDVLIRFSVDHKGKSYRKMLLWNGKETEKVRMSDDWMRMKKKKEKKKSE